MDATNALPAPNPSLVGGARWKSEEVRVFSANVGNVEFWRASSRQNKYKFDGRGYRSLRKAIEARNPHVIALQEDGAGCAGTKRLARELGYDYLSDSYAGYECLAYPKNWQVLRSTTFTANAVDTGGVMALFRTPSGRQVSVVNAHLASATSRTNGSRKNIRERQLQDAHALLEAWRREFGTVPALLVGDMNGHLPGILPSDWTVVSQPHKSTTIYGWTIDWMAVNGSVVGIAGDPIPLPWPMDHQALFGSFSLLDSP
ncbi:endonuclease/exonuclease/phosphatase family protein [Deinococcus pimensis]|uniref:endonuclease/exonuclease/phosphatase family protein n=1 Tax=Deinococcus pimensis TaxID=309888 RepID=UPI0012FAA2B5|nr:endonuclease/exonuclease/phosphatase family protein [Deinococcus pimensis]